MLWRPFLLSLLTATLMATAGFAQSNGSDDNPQSPPSYGTTGTADKVTDPYAALAVPSRNPVPGSMELGRWILLALRESREYCGHLPDPRYRIDCISERFAYIASQIDPRSRYRQTKDALVSAADDLAAVARKYRDPRAPAKYFRTAPGARQPHTPARRLFPVDPARNGAASAEAGAILDRTEKVLLRSSDDDPVVAPQVRLIAAAVGSNKTLLRST